MDEKKGVPHLRVVPEASKKTRAQKTGKNDAPPAPSVPRSKAHNAHVPTPHSRSLAAVCKASGMSHAQTAATIGISENTLRRYYAEEIENGAAVINAKIAANLASIASSRTHPKAVTAAIFWAKSRMGWKETGPLPDEDEEGGSDETTFTIGIGEKRGA